MSSHAQPRPNGEAAGPAVKDPFQSDQTAYEILALGRGADDSEVQAAFAIGVTKRVSVQKLTAARNLLLSPVDRALLDLFHYLPECAGHLTPNPIQQPLVLDSRRRGSTAFAWETQLRAGFPDLGAAHSLAVLWYWSAVAAEAGQPASESNTTQPVHQLWRSAIGCWAMVLASEEFWTPPYVRTPGDVAAKTRSAIHERLIGQIRSTSQRHRQNGAADQATQYQSLELDLVSEVRTAKLARVAGIRKGRGKLAAGALMLTQLGLLDTVRQEIEASLKRAAGNAQLNALREALSPYSPIALLIDDNRPQLALEALNRLPPSHQGVNEVRLLRAKALSALAKQQASLNDLDAALHSWEVALQSLPAAESRPAIVADIVAAVQVRATSLQANQPDQSISLLERGLTLTESPQLKQVLAEHLVNRSVRVMNETQERIGESGSSVAKQAKADLKRALEDIERAAALGSRRAKEQLDTAREVYAGAVTHLESGFADLRPDAAALVSQANQAANEGNLDEAVDLLRQALNGGNARSAGVVRKQLARALSARAVNGVNNATTAAQQLSESASKEGQRAVNRYYRSNGPFSLLFTQFAWYLILGTLYFVVDSTGSVRDKLMAGAGAIGAIALLLLLLRPAYRKVVAYFRASSLEFRAIQMGHRYYKVAANPSELLCDFCTKEPRYSMNVPGRGSRNVCEAHAEELRKLLNVDVGTYFVTTAVESAIGDLEEAQRLDPDFAEAEQHLRQLRQMQG